MPGSEHGPMLLVFSHPDDETFGAAGLMAEAVDRGIPVTLICATRGEAGDSSIPGLDDPAILGAVRERELREAMAAVGVRDVRFLEYRDSGMPGSPHAKDPRAFVNAPPEVVADQLVVAIRAMRPETVVGFGPDGIYGHDDHLVAHRATDAAVLLAGDPGHRPELGDPWRVAALYHASHPRDELQALFERRGKPGNGMPEELHARMGVPREEITHWIDISRWGAGKLAAIAAHRTQTGEGGPVAHLPEDDLRIRLGRETFVKVPLPWREPPGREDALEEIARDSPWPGPR